MRKVILGFGMSLDGYIARPDGAVDFLVMDKESEKIMNDFFKTIDVGIMGRKTMELSMKMHGGVYKSGGLETYVFSRTWKPGKHDGFQVVKGSPAVLIGRLRKRKGKNIFLMSGEIGRAFLQADLVPRHHPDSLRQWHPGLPQRLSPAQISFGLLPDFFKRQRRANLQAREQAPVKLHAYPLCLSPPSAIWLRQRCAVGPAF